MAGKRQKPVTDETLLARSNALDLREEAIKARSDALKARELEAAEVAKEVQRRFDDAMIVANLFMSRMPEAELVASFDLAATIKRPDFIRLYRQLLARHGYITEAVFEKDMRAVCITDAFMGRGRVKLVEFDSLDEMRLWVEELPELLVLDPRQRSGAEVEKSWKDRYYRKFAPMPRDSSPPVGAKRIITFILVDSEDYSNWLDKLGWVQLRPDKQSGELNPPSEGEPIRLFDGFNHRDFLSVRCKTLPGEQGWVLSLMRWDEDASASVGVQPREDGESQAQP